MPIVAMPDGTNVDMPDNPEPQLLARLRAFQQSQLPDAPMEDRVPRADGSSYDARGKDYAAPAPSTSEGPSWLGNTVDDLSYTFSPIVEQALGGLKVGADSAASGVTNLLGKIFGGTAGAAQMAVTPDQAIERPGGPADTSHGIEQFMTHQPGADTQEAMRPLGEFFSGVMKQLPDDPITQTIVPAAAEAASTLLPMRGVRPTAEGLGEMFASAPERAGTKLDRSNPVATARAAGFKVLPSDVERLTGQKPTLGQRFAEAIAPEDIRRDLTMENQPAANRLGREHIDAPEGAKLDEASLDKQKEPHFQVYEDVNKAVNVVPPSEEYLFALDDATQKAGFPAGSNPSVTEVISALRTKARRKKSNPAADDKLEAEGELASQAANKLEDAMGAELKATGNEDLITKYQDARQSLAKINDIDKIQRGGNVDPQAARKLGKKAKDRLTGPGKILADVGENFPDVRSSMTGAGKRGSTGKLTKEGIIEKGVKKLARGAVKVTGLGDRLLVDSKGFQDRIGPEATATERSYFSDYGKRKVGEPPKSKPDPGAPPPTGSPPSQGGVVPSKAVTLSERLELAPEPVKNPQRLPDKPDMLTADTPPATERGGLTFRGSRLGDDLAGDLDLDETPGRVAPGRKELSDVVAAQRSDGLEVQQPREMEQVDMPVVTEQPRRLQMERPPGTVSGKATRAPRRVTVHDSGEDLGEMFSNNASGESSASVEAIRRVRDEKKAGRERFVIDEDDTVRPLTGVDSVDARARKGQVIVQRGVGKDEYTILDRGGLPVQHAKGRIQAAMGRLKEALEPKPKLVTE